MTAVCELETQESQWCKSQSKGRRSSNRLAGRVTSSLPLFLFSASSVESMMPIHTGEDILVY